MKIEEEEEEENTIPDWAEVPDDLMELISSNLYGENRVAFGRVCRSWNSVFTTYTEHNAPRLMFYYRRCWRFSQYNSFSDKDFPQLENAEIRCSKYGWLLMSRDDFSLFFFNPFTERIRELPKYEYPYSIICFFNEPTSSNCIVFGISSSTDLKEIVIDVLKQGNEEWEMNLFMSESEYHLSYCSPVMHRGRLYLLDTKGDVSVFDPNGNDPISNGNDPIWYVYNECLFPPRLTHKIKQQFLIKLDKEEELLAVLLSNEERKVSVYRMEFKIEPRWKLVKDLGQKVLFVSHTAAFARNALYKSMGNRIYFNIFYQNTIVYYCLNTQKYYSSIHNNFSTNKSYGLKQLDFATWIMPHS